MTKKTGHSADNDTGLSSILNSNTPAVCLVGKSWDFHVDKALGITKEENLENMSGLYFDRCRPRKSSSISYNDEVAKLLWEYSNNIMKSNSK